MVISTLDLLVCLVSVVREVSCLHSISMAKIIKVANEKTCHRATGTLRNKME